MTTKNKNSLISEFRSTNFGIKLERIYTKIPSLPNRVKFGSVYSNMLNFLNKSQWYSLKELQEFQLSQLKKLLRHSNENVPYYKELFKKERIDIDKIKNLEDIKNIPPLTKEMIKNNKDKLISIKHKNKLIYVTTSGSTGSPLSFFWEKGYTNEIERAFLWHLWGIKNIKPYDRFIILRGEAIEFNRIFIYRRNNKLSISSYQLKKENLPLIINEIEKFKPQIIQAYPSSLYVLTNLLIKDQYKIPFQLKAILTSSENLYDYQEKLFIEYYNTQVYDLYGNSERTALIHRCEKNTYHIIPQYAFTEVVDNKGNWCSEDNQMGEVISTPFNNYAMPLIRHVTGDIVNYGNLKCQCGRNYETIKNIEGRKQEFYVKKDGSIISHIASNFHMKAFEQIEKFQFVQEKPGEVYLNIVVKEKIEQNTLDEIKKGYLSRLGFDSNIIINIVDDIPLAARGKNKLFIQKLHIDFK